MDDRTHQDSSALQDPGGRLTAKRLMEAFNSNQFVLYCQPIVRLRPNLSGPRYLEILVRFLEEEQLLLPPGTFLPVLDEAGLMPLLDRWVVREVLKWLRVQQEVAPNHALPRCGINLSGSVLRDRQFPAYVKHELIVSGMSPERLSFEFSMDDIRGQRQPFIDTAGLLKPLNCPIAVSGFGVGGAASLVGLSRLGVRIIKIDGGLVRMLGRKPAALQKLRNITRACAELGLLTVAEMVEDPATIGILREHGVDHAQGFGIGMPVPLAQLGES